MLYFHASCKTLHYILYVSGVQKGISGFLCYIRTEISVEICFFLNVKLSLKQLLRIVVSLLHNKLKNSVCTQCHLNAMTVDKASVKNVRDNSEGEGQHRWSWSHNDCTALLF